MSQVTSAKMSGGAARKKYVIYGSGSFGKQLFHILSCVTTADVIFVDDEPKGPLCLGVPLIRFDKLTDVEHRDRLIVIGISDCKVRKRLTKKCEEAKLSFFNVVAPTAQLIGTQTGAGSVFCNFSLVGHNTTIGKSFQCNDYSRLSHDCRVGDYVTFAPMVCCNGNVHIDDFVYVGTGALIKQGCEERPLKIGAGSTIGMGSVVLNDVEPYTIVVGTPARVIRRLDPRGE